MCMGIGCGAVGITGARIIDSPRERLIAIITNSFMPCNGRLPAIIALIAMFFTDYKDNPTIEKIFRGIRPCVVALILSPSIKLCITAKINWITAIFPIATVILICWFKISPAYIILFAVAACIANAILISKKTTPN